MLFRFYILNMYVYIHIYYVYLCIYTYMYTHTHTHNFLQGGTEVWGKFPPAHKL